MVKRHQEGHSSGGQLILWTELIPGLLKSMVIEWSRNEANVKRMRLSVIGLTTVRSSVVVMRSLCFGQLVAGRYVDVVSILEWRCLRSGRPGGRVVFTCYLYTICLGAHHQREVLMSLILTEREAFELDASLQILPAVGCGHYFTITTLNHSLWYGSVNKPKWFFHCASCVLNVLQRSMNVRCIRLTSTRSAARSGESGRRMELLHTSRAYFTI